MALALEASLLIRYPPPAAVADAFCAFRSPATGAPPRGTLPTKVDTTALIDYARLD